MPFFIHKGMQHPLWKNLASARFTLLLKNSFAVVRIWHRKVLYALHTACRDSDHFQIVKWQC